MPLLLQQNLNCAFLISQLAGEERNFFLSCGKVFLAIRQGGVSDGAEVGTYYIAFPFYNLFITCADLIKISGLCSAGYWVRKERLAFASHKPVSIYVPELDQYFFQIFWLGPSVTTCVIMCISRALANGFAKRPGAFRQRSNQKF